MERGRGASARWVLDLSAVGAVRGLKPFLFFYIFLIGKESVLLLLAGWMDGEYFPFPLVVFRLGKGLI